MEECRHRAEYVEQMRQTIEKLGELREASIAPETRSQLLEAFRGWRDRSGPIRDA